MERNGRYWNAQGGPACLEALLKRRSVVDVVDHGGGIGLGVYQREEGEETVNTEQTDASLSIT